ncbi:MAG: hypothetical protein ACLF0P_15115 [Thermoanaerobaculia bacterium]
MNLDRQGLDDVLALLRVAGELAGHGPSVEEGLHGGDREHYPSASMAQCVRHVLYGDGAGGELDRPGPDSLLGQLTAMASWSPERWEHLYQAERGAFEEDSGQGERPGAFETPPLRVNGRADRGAWGRRPNPVFRESFLSFYFDPGAAGTLRAFGELLDELACEVGANHAQNGRSFVAREMEAAALDIEHVVRELSDGAGDPEPGPDNAHLAARAERVATRLHALARELVAPPAGSEHAPGGGGPRLGVGASSGETP